MTKKLYNKIIKLFELDVYSVRLIWAESYTNLTSYALDEMTCLVISRLSDEIY
jgi:hypothetical protein